MPASSLERTDDILVTRGEGDEDCSTRSDGLLTEYPWGNTSRVSCFQRCFVSEQGGEFRWGLGVPTHSLAKTDQVEKSSRLASQNHGTPWVPQPGKHTPCEIRRGGLLRKTGVIGELVLTRVKSAASRTGCFRFWVSLVLTDFSRRGLPAGC